MTKAHSHAHLMAQYAEDAAETDMPWRRWEKRLPNHRYFHQCLESPKWDADTEYRRKPRMIRVTHEYPDGTVKTFEYPEPVREPLERGQKYFMPSTVSGISAQSTWHNDRIDHARLARGLIYHSEEASDQRRRAMLGEDGDD